MVKQMFKFIKRKIYTYIFNYKYARAKDTQEKLSLIFIYDKHMDNVLGD